MIRAMVVDDEMAAVGKLSEQLKESGVFRIVDSFTDPTEALKKAAEFPYDAAFLDIEMPEIDGMRLANYILDTSSQTKIVFVTAYNEYAIQAFELNAIDYLLKPVTKERLQKSLARLSDQHKEKVDPVSALKVTCFGKFRAEQANGLPVKWRTHKTEEMFAYLVDQNGKWVSRDKMLEIIWNEFEGTRASGNFSTCLYNMRKTLANLGCPELFVSENGMYKLDMKHIFCDAHQFEQMISSLDRINEDNLPHLEEILEKAGEGYFESNYYEWAETKRRWLEEAYMQQVIRLARYLEQSGREKRAIIWLKKGLSKDFFHPNLHYTLLELYSRSNNRAAALKHYDDYRRKLIEEYGIEPDRELEQMMRRIT